MENQPNTDNQNAQQIGQNPVAQPVQIPEKPKVNYWIISTVILFVLLIAVSIFFVFKSKNGQFQPKQSLSTNDSKLIINEVEKIAYIKNGEIWTVNEDGTEQNKIYSHSNISFSNPSLTSQQNKAISDYFNKHYFTDLSWSKDGKEIAVTAFSKNIEKEAEDPTSVEKFNLKAPEYWAPPHGDIYLIDLETGEVKNVPEKSPRDYIYSVRWSKDNRQLIFRRESPFGNSQQNEIVLLNIDSLKETKLTTTERSNEIEWDQTTELIIYNDKGSYHISKPFPAIVTLNYVTGNKNESPYQFTNGYRPQFFRLLSDDRVIYYSSALGPEYKTQYGQYEIRISDLKGAQNEILFSGSGCDEEARSICVFLDFAPNGKYLLGQVAGTDEQGKNMMIYHIYDTKLPQKAIMGIKSENLQSFSWDRTGEKIAYIDTGSVAVTDLINGETQKIVSGTDISELRWAY